MALAGALAITGITTVVVIRPFTGHLVVRVGVVILLGGRDGSGVIGVLGLARAHPLRDDREQAEQQGEQVPEHPVHLEGN